MKVYIPLLVAFGITTASASFSESPRPDIDAPEPVISGPAGSLRQTTRSAIVSRQHDRTRGRRATPSGLGSVGTRTGAVFTNVGTSDEGGTFEDISEPATDIVACAQSCAANAGCTFAYIWLGDCWLKGSTRINGMTFYNGEDQFVYVGKTCAEIKAAVLGASEQRCYNLAY